MAAETLTTMDLVYDNSVSIIQSLQTRFEQQSDLFFTISNVFDPRYAFLFFAPLIYSFDRTIGKRILLVAIVSEWANQILKWMLRGERPYWWVHETAMYNRTGSYVPAIQQYSLTCETGPGSPSGHAMCTASLWYIIIDSFLKKFGATNKNNSMLCSTCWSVYTLILAAVTLSRVYIAAHFPHQCILGMAIGCSVAMAMSNFPVDKLKFKHYAILTFGLLTSALATYTVIRIMGMNPMWSVDRAMKWCARQEYIHLDTTPFFSMMRYCGFALGTGLGLSSVFNRKISNVAFTTSMKVTSAILAIVTIKLSELIILPKSNVYYFYSMAFCLNVILPYLFIAVVPFVVHKMWQAWKSANKVR